MMGHACAKKSSLYTISIQDIQGINTQTSYLFCFLLLSMTYAESTATANAKTTATTAVPT